MDRVWLKNYPLGVPADINPDEYSSLVELIAESVERFEDRPAFKSMGRTIACRATSPPGCKRSRT